MIVGSIAAVAILLVLVLVLVNRGDDDPAPAGDGDGGSTPVASTDGTSASTSDPLTSGMPAPVPGATPVAPVPGMPTAPIAGADADEDDPGATKPPVRRGGSPRLKDVQLKTFDWPDEVDEETRAQAELQVENLWIGGRDGADAEEWFVEQGNKLAGRLISEFPRIQQEYGLEDRRAKTDFMVLDRILSKMDGYIARKWHSTHPITHVSTESIIEKRLKQWTVWFDMGYWSEPVRPWDPRVDEEDSAEDGAKPKPKERGFAENK